MRFRLPTLVLSFAALATASGCARPETAADRHVAKLTEDIKGIQADQDKSPKVGRLDPGEDKAIAAKTPAAPPSSAKTAPPPRVVQLGGDGSFENDDPNDPSQRPEIKVVGSPGSGGSARSSSRRGSIRMDVDGDPGSSSSGRPSALDPDARKAYDDALALVNAKQNDRALEAFNAFLVRWPDHPYVENAMYWRGEIYFAQGEYLRAAEQFEAVVARFGGGRKAPDALLKIGMCHERLGAQSRAQDYWARLKREFPKSDAARKIPKESR